jgi:hypothetical protein
MPLLVLLLTLLLPWTLWAQMHPFPGPGVKGTAGGGPPVRVGTPIALNATQNNSGSVSVTVPATANFMFCAISGYMGTASYFSTGTMTIAGAAMTMITGGDSNSGAWMAVGAYKLLPATGSQTLAWDWLGTTNTSDTTTIMCSWYQGVNTSTPVRTSLCNQSAANPHSTGSLTAVTGDLAVIYVTQFAPSDTTFTWTGATEVSEFGQFSGGGDGSLAEALPTGNITVSATGLSNQDGGTCALILRQ